MFDLMTYAERHRYRLGNLNDGRPLHPLRVPVTNRGKATGYRAPGDRMDAIICHNGYVVDDGDGRIGWYIAAETAKDINLWLRKLVALGAVVGQRGDSEAAGDAPAERIGDVLRVLQPFKQRPPNPGNPV